VGGGQDRAPDPREAAVANADDGDDGQPAIATRLARKPQSASFTRHSSLVTRWPLAEGRPG
jgi:hypothetical protein